MAEDPVLCGKRVLLLDRKPKSLNDRTWCFWEETPAEGSPREGLNYFESIVHHQWEGLWLRHPLGNINLPIAPFKYKMIRGLDFYNYCFGIISRSKNITVNYAEITGINAEQGIVSTENGDFSATRIFSSVLLNDPVLHSHQLYLLQHFRGWWIETETDCFSPGEADLMNFNTSQQYGCAFVYVLPVSKRRALVEYTLFSEQELEDSQYDEGLKTFIAKQLKLQQYHIAEVENGIIPMTDLNFESKNGRVTFIGTAGGFTKASTGYTFQFIQKSSHQIVKALSADLEITFEKPPRFSFYDSVFLRVLHERKQAGADVFYHLFRKNKASGILRFLNNETRFFQEIAIMSRTRKAVFVMAALAVIRKLRQVR